MKLIITLVLALTVVAIAAYWWQPDRLNSEQASRVATLHMANGDLLQGRLALDQINIETPYGQIGIPQHLLIGATELAGQQPGETLMVAGGDQFSGMLTDAEIALTLLDGNNIRIQKDMITQIELPAPQSDQIINPPDVVAMRNGDIFQATINDDEFSVKTTYGVLDLKKSSVEYIDFSGGNDGLTVKISLNDREGIVQGVLQNQQINVHTRADQALTIKPAQLQRLVVATPLSEVAAGNSTTSPNGTLRNLLGATDKPGFNAPGFTFQDSLENGKPGPEMVLIPAGTYSMGSPEEESERDKDETQHSVTITKPFAVGKYEVTFAEYDNFAESTGREKPYDQDWGRDNRPVLNISWHDALAYVKWLSEQTDRPYRLLTEAEWEYVARAGTTTVYWWGDTLQDNLAICKDCSSQWQKRETASVGLLPANGFGLHDMLGNVWEWTCSEYQENYLGAELRCAEEDNEELRSIRGGSYLNSPAKIRAATRDTFSPVDSNELVGFRLARDL